jgi:DNA-directed RNA polymerase specialized sigma24 family protein
MSKDTRKEPRDTKEWNQDMWDTYCEMLEIPRLESLTHDGTEIETVDHSEAMKKLWDFSPELPAVESKEIIHALDELPYLEKDMILQYFWDGKTIREIAKNLERPHLEVWRRIHGAMQKLRAILKQRIKRLGCDN